MCSWEKSREVNRKHLGGCGDWGEWSQFSIGLLKVFIKKKKKFQLKPEGSKIKAIKILGRVF